MEWSSYAVHALVLAVAVRCAFVIAGCRADGFLCMGRGVPPRCLEMRPWIIGGCATMLPRETASFELVFDPSVSAQLLAQALRHAAPAASSVPPATGWMRRVRARPVHPNAVSRPGFWPAKPSVMPRAPSCWMLRCAMHGPERPRHEPCRRTAALRCPGQTVEHLLCGREGGRLSLWTLKSSGPDQNSPM
jgi:hypothetical protein